MVKNIPVKSCIIGVGCLLALVACKRDHVDREGPVLGDRTSYDNRKGTNEAEEKTGSTTITGANVGAVANDLAVQRIVAARCAREAACNNVGSDKHFVSHDVCVQEIRDKMRNDLKASECPKGIDAKELDDCMEAIHKESCNNPIDVISRLAACRTSGLCLTKDETPSAQKK